MGFARGVGETYDKTLNGAKFEMKMWKEKTWQYEITGVDGNTILYGVNIFDYPWNFIKREIVKNKVIDIYSIKIDDSEYVFGALEASNCVWDFYLFKY